jgi:hypothetical protein
VRLRPIPERERKRDRYPAAGNEQPDNGRRVRAREQGSGSEAQEQEYRRERDAASATLEMMDAELAPRRPVDVADPAVGAEPASATRTLNGGGLGRVVGAASRSVVWHREILPPKA